MKLSDLLSRSEVDREEILNFSDVEITDIVTDSRKACLGCMFICMVGKSFDGHRYIREAMLRGAVAVVVQWDTEAKMPEMCPYINIIRCKSTRRAAAMLYGAWYGNPAKSLRLIAVTGTNGKTSVTHMLKSVFESAMYRCGIIGTVMCGSGERKVYASPDDPLANMTTPDPKQLHQLLAFMAADKVEYVFMEASSHALKLCKVDGITFDSAVFTNLSPEHLDFHGDMQDYVSSKARLFAISEKSFVNIDDASSELMISSAKGEVYTYSPSGKEVADFYAEGIENKGLNGIAYTLRSKNKMMHVSSRIPGGFTVDNTLCTAAVALEHGISPATVHESIRAIPGVEGRIERVMLSRELPFAVFIDYAHTPDALESLLLAVGRFGTKANRKVLLFGCGGDRDKSKRSVMGGIASRLADHIIITSDNSRSEKSIDIISDIVSGIEQGSSYEIIEDRRAAIEKAIKNALPGDIIILAGKGHEKYEIDQDGKHDFDEKKIVFEFCRKYYSES